MRLSKQVVLLSGAIAALVFIQACSNVKPLPRYGKLPAFDLTSQDGKPFRSSDQLAGKVWVADFIFTNCQGPCPRMTSEMHSLQKDFTGQNNMRFVSITVDPANDTPAVLADFAQRYRAADGWYFLTGPQKALNTIAYDGFHLGYVDGTLQHSTRFVLVDGQAQIRGYYESNKLEDMQKLRDDARQLLKEPS